MHSFGNSEYYYLAVSTHRSTEVWKPKENESLDTLKVNKDMPSIHILLSKTPVNPDSPR